MRLWFPLLLAACATSPSAGDAPPPPRRAVFLGEEAYPGGWLGGKFAERFETVLAATLGAADDLKLSRKSVARDGARATFEAVSSARTVYFVVAPATGDVTEVRVRVGTSGDVVEDDPLSRRIIKRIEAKLAP